MTGYEGYNHIADMMTQKFVKHVHENWKKKLGETLSHASLEVYCNQVKRCVEIALDCLKPNRHERPAIRDIVSSLNETETMIGDRGLQIEQFYKPILPSMSSITSRPSSGHGEASRSTYTENYFPAVQPVVMPWRLLENLTDGFSRERLLGVGSYGEVYKAVYEDGQVIAVRKLPFSLAAGLSDEQFQRVITDLMKVHHQNIVQLVGYCSETEMVIVPYEGRFVHAHKIDRAMCFEYSPNGSLAQHISDISSGLDWYTRYEIIKGTCKGLRYLHEGLPSPIIHKDLAPSNILLDENMVPKIAYLGMSGLSSQGVKTIFIPGTTAYLPPEFVLRQVISKEYDIYSLGVVIIEIMTGERDLYPESELVHENWRERLQRTVKDTTSVEGYCQLVKKCLEIALKCVDRDRHKRPAIGDIVHTLNETESLIQEPPGALLDVHPSELCFPIPRKGKAMSCSLQLNNKGDDRVAFMLVPKRKKPLCGVVPPRCAYTLTLTMPKQPPSDSADFFTLHSVAVGHHDLLGLVAVDQYDNFFKSAGDEVQEVMLKAICDRPADRGTSSEVISLPTRSTVEIITTPDAREVSCIDVHPTQPWIMTTNHVGSLRVWNYQTMATLNSFQLVTDEPVHAAKFIAREKWVVAGDGNGGIHVYSYDQNQDVESFDAHESRITSLAVHPTGPFVLSSSDDDDHLIKLWDWDKGWECTRTFQGHAGRVTQLTFNPDQGTDTFASASLDGTVKIWSINSDDPSNIITLDGKVDSLLCVDYFTRHNRQHLITGCKDRTAQIWNLGIEGCVHKLEGHADRISAVNLHPELPMLTTGSHDGTVRLWNSTTYKLENIIGFNLGAVYAFGCIKDSRRIVVGCHQGIAVMEISLP